MVNFNNNGNTFIYTLTYPPMINMTPNMGYDAKLLKISTETTISGYIGVTTVRGFIMWCDMRG